MNTVQSFYNQINFPGTCSQIKHMLPEFNLINSYPSSINIVSHIESFFNYRNGGLITYIFERNS